MPNALKDVRTALRKVATAERAAGCANFFKCGPGQYGEGDVFLGVTVPQTRAIAKTCKDLTFDELAELLASKFHEERSLALIVLVERFTRSRDEAMRRAIYEFYFANVAGINNWDLVDVSAPYIVGGYLESRSRAPLHKLAKSKNLWERRIAIVATWWLIRRDDYDDCLTLCETLIADKHDLIHKACGWMLREVGKRDTATLERFLAIHHRRLPRTALRYAIERFPPERRKAYLTGYKQP
ncbi:MAG: DNA alkylation repair protein [Pirellulales bacterium]